MQTRITQNRSRLAGPSSNASGRRVGRARMRVLLWVSIWACGGALGSPHAIAADDTDDPALLAEWQDVAEKIGAGEPWPDCRAALEAAIEKHPNSKYVRHCRQLIDDILITEMIEARLGSPESVDAENLTCDYLVFSKVEAGLVVAPLYLYGKTLKWQRNAQAALRNDADVAYRIYNMDRPVIKRLMGELINQAATRSVRVRRQPNDTPAVMRVSDLSLALIEAKSRCRFRTDAQLHIPFSKTSPIVRQNTIDQIERWWDKTRDMDPAAAVVWQLEHGDLDKPYQMLQVLRAMGENQALIDYLSNHYRAGDAIDYNAAVQLIRAGSNEPLEYIRHVAEDGGQLTLDMAKVIASSGRRDDFALLSRIVSPGGNDLSADNADWHASIIVRAMRQSKNRYAIPVLVSVVDGFLDRRGFTDSGERVIPARWPQHIIDAALEVQNNTGVNFGIDPTDTPEGMYEAMRRMLTWWREDGRSVYDFYGIDPRSPGGIR